MSESKDEDALVDLLGLLEQVDDDVEFGVELMGDAMSEFGTYISNMKASIEKRSSASFDELRVAAHSIKGVLSNLQMLRMQDVSRIFEAWATSAMKMDLQGDAKDEAFEEARRQFDDVVAIHGDLEVFAEDIAEKLERALKKKHSDSDAK
ncbi:hypothetical protein M885DRAFT_545729 [Pelagophyceae sp. CCMP2097]|nr:hypothetical protein M885DRAFT_545729 [Pelagophyceae sp. CCMP2097]